MKRRTSLKHEFVEYIPDQMEEGVLYISMEYSTVVHKCCCGCGNKVVTPLSPTDWTLIYDGNAVTLDPSIGNWGYECGSHYWIESNRIIWAGKWSKARIEAVRQRDYIDRKYYYNDRSVSNTKGSSLESVSSRHEKSTNLNLLSRLRKWLISR